MCRLKPVFILNDSDATPNEDKIHSTSDPLNLSQSPLSLG